MLLWFQKEKSKNMDSRLKISGMTNDVDARLKNFGNEGRRKITAGRNIRPSQLPLAIVYNNTLAQKIVEPKEGENYHEFYS